jgi:hypothetical protein
MLGDVAEDAAQQEHVGRHGIAVDGRQGCVGPHDLDTVEVGVCGTPAGDTDVAIVQLHEERLHV